VGIPGKRRYLERMRPVFSALLLLFGCQGSDPPGDPSGDDVPTEPSESTPPTAGLALTVQDHVSLDYATVGQTPTGSLTVDNRGDRPTGDLDLAVEGSFDIAGDLGSLAPGEQRVLEVTWTGATDAPMLGAGEAMLGVDGGQHRIGLAAVIGDASLPAAEWAEDAWGRWTEVDLPTAPFQPDGTGPWYDPSVLIWVPNGLSETGPLHVVTHLHGHYATVADTVADQSLLEQASLSGRDAVVIVPQGPVETASNDFGQLDDPGGHLALLGDAVAVLYRDGVYRDAVLGQQVLTAHSGGYAATAQIIEDGGLPIDAAHLFDGLYGYSGIYADFARSGGVFRSTYTPSGGTVTENVDLAAELDGDGIDVGSDFSGAELYLTDVVIGPSDASHDGVISDRLWFARWLIESGLPAHALSPPELRTVLPSGPDAVVSWRVDRGGSRNVVVEGSTDGMAWEDLGTSTSGSLTVPPRAWMRVRAETGEVRSEPSDAYGQSGDDWLVVDGFDRVLGGSWTEPTHDFAASVASVVGAGCASNEAVANAEVALGDFTGVIWLLGDESTADDTFDDAEQALIEAYVASGGRLIVSGSEVGFATDSSFLSNVLHAGFVADSAGTLVAGGYTFGVAYEEDWPDVLSGDEVIWSYDTGGAAAVRWNDQVTVVGFPLETLAPADLAPALAELTAP